MATRAVSCGPRCRRGAHRPGTRARPASPRSAPEGRPKCRETEIVDEAFERERDGHGQEGGEGERSPGQQEEGGVSALGSAVATSRPERPARSCWAVSQRTRGTTRPTPTQRTAEDNAPRFRSEIGHGHGDGGQPGPEAGGAGVETEGVGAQTLRNRLDEHHRPENAGGRCAQSGRPTWVTANGAGSRCSARSRPRLP